MKLFLPPPPLFHLNKYKKTLIVITTSLLLKGIWNSISHTLYLIIFIV